MSSELKSLSELFQKRIFRIPDYQRGYAWKSDQLIDFWEDLQNLSDVRYHYTGLLSLKKISKNDKSILDVDKWLLNGQGFDLYHVVDGQQRLTTFSILIFEIVKFVKNLGVNKNKTFDDIIFDEFNLSEIIDNYISKTRKTVLQEKVYLFGYAKDNPSAKYLIHDIFEEQHGETTKETYYTRNLKYAKLFFNNNISVLYENHGIIGLQNLFKKATQNLKFNIHEIDDEYDVFVAFETMNNRGKRLTHLELLKNRLIYLTTLYREEELDNIGKDNLRGEINSAWQEVYFQLGRNDGILLPDDDLLRAHWILYFQYTRKRGDDYIGFLLNRKFTSKNIFINNALVIAEQTVELIDSGDDADEIEDEMEELVQSNLKPNEIKDYIYSLKDFSKYWFFSHFPQECTSLTEEEKTWITKLNRIGIADFRPLVATALSINVSSVDRISLFKAIERFIFLFYRVGRWRGNYKNSAYFMKARKMFEGSYSAETITQDLTNDINNELNTIISSFINDINRRFNNGTGFYYWSGLRYFFYEYENSIIPFDRTSKIDWDLYTKPEKSKISIEHILPQTPTNEYWNSRFSQYSEEQQKSLIGAIGNLLPLSLSINIQLQNDSFPDKKTPKNGRSGYSTGSYSEIEVSLNSEWSAPLIKQRSIQLIKFMGDRWGIPFTEDDIEKIVHLDFLNISKIN